LRVVRKHLVKDNKNIDYMLEDKDPEEIEEVLEIAENQGVDVEEAEHIKEIMDEEGVDEDDAAELAEAGL
jgi:hypothetical protein